MTVPALRSRRHLFQPGNACGLEASGNMAWCDGVERRKLALAMLDFEAAARTERAALVEPREVRRLAFDGIEFRLARLVHARH